MTPCKNPGCTEPVSDPIHEVCDLCWIDSFNTPSFSRLVKREELQERVFAELDRAYAKHGKEPWGRHEFYGVLLEEVEELWDAIKRDLPMADLEAELVQVAAMCFRFFETGERYGFVGKPSADVPRCPRHVEWYLPGCPTCDAAVLIRRNDSTPELRAYWAAVEAAAARAPKRLLGEVANCASATRIFVNGSSCTYSEKAISYNELVKLAGLDPDLVYTIVYFVSYDDYGSVLPGQAINVVPNMRFSVADTSNA